MQDGKVMGQLRFFTEKKPEYVIFTNIYKYKIYFDIAKKNLARGKSNRPNHYHYNRFIE